TAAWDQLTPDQVLDLFPKYLDSIGYLDMGKYQTFTSQTWGQTCLAPVSSPDQVNGFANYALLLQACHGTGNFQDWAWGGIGDAPHLTYTKPFLVRRHVAALFIKAVGQYFSFDEVQAYYAETNADGTTRHHPDYMTLSVHNNGYLGNGQPWIFDPFVEDDLGPVQPIKLTDEQWKKGLA